MQVQLKQALGSELRSILDYWIQHTVDETHGGFFGKLGNDNVPDPFAVKGAVLNARILWAFAAAFRVTGEEKYLLMAQRAFAYITAYFVDKEYGGVMWTVDYAGRPIDTKKEVYAIAFVISAFSEYYKASHDEKAREMAAGLYALIHLYGYDPLYGGYREAFTRDWKEESGKAEQKSTDTHLHVLEAFVALYAIWPDQGLRLHILDLLNIFYDKIIDQRTGHLRLYFDQQWNVQGTGISFGHDMEASWLLLEAAEVMEDETLVAKFRTAALQMADAAMEGMDVDGGLWFAYAPDQEAFTEEKHWWSQAEAIIGLVNAWQINQQDHYLEQALRSWQFIQQHILDKTNGEWFWGIQKDRQMMEEDKVNLWKSPYHNSRACLQILRRL